MVNNFLVRMLSLVLTIYLVVYLPIYNEFTTIRLFNGIVGNLSISSLLFLSVWLLHFMFSGKKSILLNSRFGLILTITGAVLYLSTFGFIPFDIYGLGYFPNLWLLIGFCIVEICLWYTARMYAWLWLLGLASFYFKLENSNNLWDYLFDPILWLLSIVSLFSYHKKIDEIDI